MSSLDEQIIELQAIPPIPTLIRESCEGRSVSTARRADYLSIRPAPEGAIAVYFHARRISIAADPDGVDARAARVPGSSVERKTPATHYVVIDEPGVSPRNREVILALIRESLDWRAEGPRSAVGANRSAKRTQEPDICPNCNTTVTPANTCWCDE